MNVEKAGLNDIDALVELRLAYLREDFGRLDDADLAVIRKDLPGYFEAHLGRDLFVYVIRDGKSIVSCAFLLVIEKPMSPAFLNGRTGMVLNVYTCTSHRQRGYAGAIMKMLIDEAKEKGKKIISENSKALANLFGNGDSANSQPALLIMELFDLLQKKA